MPDRIGMKNPHDSMISAELVPCDEENFFDSWF